MKKQYFEKKIVMPNRFILIIQIVGTLLVAVGALMGVYEISQKADTVQIAETTGFRVFVLGLVIYFISKLSNRKN